MNRLIALVSLVVLVGTLVINSLAGTGQINGIATGEVSGLYPTLFTPAGFTFAIWSVIYLLNIAYVIANIFYAFKKPELFQRPLVQLFMGVCLVNIAWIFAWHYDQILVSVFLMLSILVTLIAAFMAAHGIKDKGFASKLTRINFGVYLGWISVATIANLSILISGKGNTDWAQSDLIWTWVVIGAAVGLAIFIMLRLKSLAYGLVIAWALYGIYSARLGVISDIEFKVADAALLGLILVLVTSGYVFIRKLISLRS